MFNQDAELNGIGPSRPYSVGGSQIAGGRPRWGASFANARQTEENDSAHRIGNGRSGRFWNVHSLDVGQGDQVPAKLEEPLTTERI